MQFLLRYPRQFFLSLFHATPGNVSLPKDQKSKLRRYRKDLRMLMLKKTGLHKRKRILQKRGFLSALLVPLATSIPLPLVTILNRRRRSMQTKWHCWIFVFWRTSNRKFLLVLLSLYEMRDNLERGDLHEKGKVVSCNVVLNRYNTLSNKGRQQPLRVIVNKLPCNKEKK